MASGLLLGRLLPGLQSLLGTVQVGHTSLPIALGLLPPYRLRWVY